MVFKLNPKVSWHVTLAEEELYERAKRKGT
jgi:hypothetical protein